MHHTNREFETLLKDTTVIPVMVIKDSAEAIPMAKALLAKGYNTLEITLRTEFGLLAISEIADQLLRHSSAQGQVDALVNAALKAGGRDNITVVVVGAPPGSGDLQENPGTEPGRRNAWLLSALVVIVIAVGLLALI